MCGCGAWGMVDRDGDQKSVSYKAVEFVHTSKSDIELLVTRAVLDLVAMQELVKLLCSPDIRSELAKEAYYCFSRHRDKTMTTETDHAENTRRLNMLGLIAGYKECGLNRDESFFWSHYKLDSGGPYIVSEEYLEEFD
jgi:hypothetical protein